MRARDIMTKAVRTASADTLVRDIAKMMAKRRISAIPIVDRRRHVLGIVSEGDLLHRRELGTARPSSWWLGLLSDSRVRARRYAKDRAIKAGDVMTRRVVSVTPDAELAEVADLLENQDIKRVPVVRSGRLVGIVSRGDLVRALARLAARPTKRKVTDARISAALQDEIRRADGIDNTIVNFSVTRGVVELSGLAPHDEQKRALQVLAEAVPGVLGVTNRIGIKPISIY
jgi:CBS domain-containing protein